MPQNDPPTAKATLGLTGLTINAMALIAPGAFLWLTFQMQSLYGAPMAGSAMWFGIVLALMLCLATAVSYAELSKIYPGAGSSYFYAEQAFLSKTKAYKFARIMKFFTGWASHLYYWVYPGVMVGVTAILGGYMVSQIFPNTFSGTYNSPLFMILFCVVFALGVGYIAFRGVTGTTGVNMAINIIQISALLVFTVIAIGYRMNHPQDSKGWHLSNGTAITYQVAQTDVLDDKGAKTPDAWADNSPKYVDAKGNAVADEKDAAKDKDGKPMLAYKQQDRQVTKDDLDKDKNKDADTLAALTAMGLGEGDPYPVLEKGKDGKLAAVDFTVSYKPEEAVTGAGTDKDPTTFNFHTTATSVISPHNFKFIFIQACIAILILVGFESVTAMGEEAKNAKRDVPRAVLLSLIIQGAFCYLIEYFGANYLLHNGYTIPNAGASGAPLGDMMVLVGSWLFGSYNAGWWFMMIQASTVFLALIGTTLSCLSTGARVTYAMGRDEELGAHFGVLHGKTFSPHRAIWTLAIISIIIGIVTVVLYMGGQSTAPAPLDPKYKNIWYSFGIFSPETYTKLPNTLLITTLISNFGTFLLYMTTCIVAIVAFREHQAFHGFKHVVVPIFGLLANLSCMLFYLVGPFSVAGMSWKEPYYALGACAIWGTWGVIYFLMSSKSKGKSLYAQQPATAS
jgi:amino acid transporter